jgi:hypothetical protein
VSKQAGSATRVWFDNHKLSAYLASAEQTINIEAPVVTCFGDAGPRRVVGNWDHSHQYNGFFDGAPSGIDAVIAARGGNSYYLCNLFSGATVGNPVYESYVTLTDRPRAAQAGGAVTLNLSAVGTNKIGRGRLLYDATATGTGLGTAVNMGAHTITMGPTWVVYRVFGGTFTECIVQILESQDDGSGDPYASIAGAEITLTAAGTEAREIAAGTALEAWRKVNITGLTGTNILLGVTMVDLPPME